MDKHWRRHHGGAGWRYLDDGRIILEDAARHIRPLSRKGENVGRWFLSRTRFDEDGALRTNGRPLSMMALEEQYYPHIELAASLFGVPHNWIAGMISIEAGRKSGYRWDNVSLRKEKGYVSDKLTPHRISVGPMQTLISTARRMQKLRPDIAQDILGLRRPVGRDELSDPRVSILLGTAYMEHLILTDHGARGLKSYRRKRFGAAEDFILLIGSYNAGALMSSSSSSSSPWKIITHGALRIPKAVAYHNDWLALQSGAYDDERQAA